MQPAQYCFFIDIAQKAKSTMCWFKLYLVINDYLMNSAKRKINQYASSNYI
jgi:hypothetical protein